MKKTLFPAKNAENILYICRNIYFEMVKYIYQHKNWTDFVWDYGKIAVTLGEVRNLQGKLSGAMNTLGFSLKSEAMLETLTLDVMKSSEIEGEKLNLKQVRSSYILCVL